MLKNILICKETGQITNSKLQISNSERASRSDRKQTALLSALRNQGAPRRSAQIPNIKFQTRKGIFWVIGYCFLELICYLVLVIWNFRTEPIWLRFVRVRCLRNPMSNKAGFTLIEIVVSLGVFLLGFVGVITLFLGGFHAQDEARSRVTEAIIADNLFAALTEAEHPGITPFLTGVDKFKKSNILESEHYPGYSYFFTVEPYGISGGQQNRLFVALYVFETKYKQILYEKDYSTLSEKEKTDYDRNCIACHTIIDMEF